MRSGTAGLLDFQLWSSACLLASCRPAQLSESRRKFSVLVLLSLLYAAVGILLACIALRARPSVSNNIQGRLSVTGLAAQCFESEERREGPTKEIQDLFEENEVRARDQKCPKVAIVASGRGGWKYDLVGQDERRNSATLTSRGNKSVEPFVRTVSIS
jgi:hypothetical protein